FVVTRPMYLNNFAAVGRPREGIERFFLSVAFDRGRFFPSLSEKDWNYLRTKLGEPTVNTWRQSPALPTLKDLPILLDRYRARYVVAGPQLDMSDELFREKLFGERQLLLKKNGYRRVYHGKEYDLWRREIPPSP